jgi:hypothetical protein
MKPSHDLIVRMHHEHAAQQAAIHDRIHEIHQRIVTAPTDHENTVTQRSDQTSNDAK